MGAVYARDRFGVEHPRVALLSIGEEPTKGNPLVKETHKLLAEPGWAGTTGATFAGNVEGRDLMTDAADVVVTDGFTGNVALKTLEGGMRALVGGVLAAFETDDATRGAAEVLLPALAPLYQQLDPENVGGAMLLGVDGVCIISHGSSSATAMVNAIRVARDMVAGDVVEHLRSAVTAG
jgi:glycerol-3-phosphate acyltransferase PlsX